MVATGETVDLAEWIIDYTCLVVICISSTMTISRFINLEKGISSKSFINLKYMESEYFHSRDVNYEMIKTVHKKNQLPVSGRYI